MSDSVTAEATSRLLADMQAWQDTYADAESALDILLSPIQSAMFHRTGLVPLSVIRRALDSDTINTETLSALVRSGTTDTEADYALRGASMPLGDYIAGAQYYPGRHDGPRYVRVPWLVTVDEWDERLEAYADDVAEESALAHAPGGGSKRQVAFRLDDVTVRALDTYAAHAGMTRSEAVRTAVGMLTGTTPARPANGWRAGMIGYTRHSA